MSITTYFVGRQKEMDRLRQAYGARRHVLIAGPAGIGKSALIRQARQYFPFLLCEETSSLRKICESFERQLGWTHRKMNVIERKNRLLPHLARRGELLVLDGVTWIPPRVARFIAHLAECIPVWITARSAQRKEIGAIGEHLYRFERLEIGPLSRNETAALVQNATTPDGSPVFSQAQAAQLHHLAGGVPRVLEELLIELASREYQLDDSFDRKLLDLDHRIRNAATLAAVRF